MMPQARVLVAAACGAIAQVLAARGTEGLSLAVAGVLFATGGWLLARADRERVPVLEIADEPPPMAPLRRLRWSWLLLVLALALSGAAASRVEITLSKWQVGAWLAAMLALLAFAYAADRGAPVSGNARREPDRGDWKSLAAMALLAAIAFAWRLWGLADNPPLIWDDEIVYLLDGLDLGGFGPFSPFANGGWGAPHLHAYSIAAATWLVADRGAALRLVSAIPGALSVPLLWLALRELFDRRFAFFGALLLAFAAWPTILSRQGYIWAINPFAELIALYGLARGLRRGRFVDYAVAGLGLGLCVFYGYTGMMMPLVIVAFVLYLGIAARRWLASQLGGLALLVLASVVFAAPRLTTVAADPEARAYFQRSSLFTTEAEGALQGVARQLGQIAISFNRRADNNELFVPVANAPLLDPITAAAFGLGCFWALFSLRQLGAMLMLTTFAILILPPALGLSSTEWATAWRACGAVPAVFGLAAAPLAIGVGAGRRPRAIVTAVLAALLAAAAFINWQWYFVRHPAKARWHYGSNAMRTRAAKMVLAAPPRTRVFVNFDLEAFQMVGLATGRREYDSLTWPDDEMLPRLGEKPQATLVVAAAQLYWEDDVSTGTLLIDLLQHYYPGGRRTDEQGADGRPLFAAYEMSAQQISAAHGLSERGDGLSGTLYVEQDGIYRLGVGGDDRASVRLNGRPFAQGPLPKGLYAIEVSGVTKPIGPLLWRRKGDAPEKVPTANLLRRGLPEWGYAERVLDLDGREVWRQWVPNLWFSAPGRAFEIGPEYAVEWTGEVEMPKSAAYTVLFMASARSSLWIDGEQIFADLVAWPSWERIPLELSAGRHSVRVRSEPLVETRDVHLYWVESGQPGHFKSRFEF